MILNVITFDPYNFNSISITNVWSEIHNYLQDDLKHVDNMWYSLKALKSCLIQAGRSAVNKQWLVHELSGVQQIMSTVCILILIL